jgi:hypothetical protein
MGYVGLGRKRRTGWGGGGSVYLTLYITGVRVGLATRNGEQGPRGAGAEGPLAPPVWKMATQAAFPFPHACTDTHTHTQNLSA